MATMPNVLIDIARCNIIGASQNFRRRIIIADNIRFFRCTMFRYDFDMGFVIWRLAVIVLAQYVTIYIKRIDNYVGMWSVSQFRIAIGIVGVNYDIFPRWRNMAAAVATNIGTYYIRFIVIRTAEYAEIIIVRNVQV